jgi:hypothetical protein
MLRKVIAGLVALLLAARASPALSSAIQTVTDPGEGMRGSQRECPTENRSPPIARPHSRSLLLPL